MKLKKDDTGLLQLALLVSQDFIISYYQVMLKPQLTHMIIYQNLLHHIIIVYHHKWTTMSNQLFCEFSGPLVTVSTAVITVCNPL